MAIKPKLIILVFIQRRYLDLELTQKKENLTINLPLGVLQVGHLLWILYFVRGEASQDVAELFVTCQITSSYQMFRSPV